MINQENNQASSNYLSQQQQQQQHQQQQYRQSQQHHSQKQYHQSQQFDHRFGYNNNNNSFPFPIAPTQQTLIPSQNSYNQGLYNKTEQNPQLLGFDQHILINNQYHTNVEQQNQQQQIPTEFIHQQNFAYPENSKSNSMQYQNSYNYFRQGQGVTSQNLNHQEHQQYQQLQQQQQLQSQHQQQQNQYQQRQYQNQQMHSQEQQQKNLSKVGNYYNYQHMPNTWSNTQNTMLSSNKNQNQSIHIASNPQFIQTYPTNIGFNQPQLDSEEQGSPSLVLLVIIFELKDLQITNDQIQQIFSPFGFVNKVLIFIKSPDQTKAFVEMDSIESAKKAKEALNKVKIHLTPHQKYKFKVHYSETTELNLSNYKTEGKDYRISPFHNNSNKTAVVFPASQSSTYQEKQYIQIQPSQPTSNNKVNQTTNFKEQSFQMSSSQNSIPSPIDRQSPNLIKSGSNNDSVSQNQHSGVHRHFKNVSNSIGKTIGAIVYIEKGNQQQTQEYQDDQMNILNYQSQVSMQQISYPEQQIQNNIQQCQNSSAQGIQQIFSNSMQSLTSSSTPTSQASYIHSIAQIKPKINQTKNENNQQDLTQQFMGLSLNQNNYQQSQDDYEGEEEDNIKSLSDIKMNGLCLNLNDTHEGECMNAVIGQGYKGSSSLLLAKLESCDSFNQVTDQSTTSNQNLPEFNFQQIGITNMNNQSNQSQQMIDNSPRKGSIIFTNSEIVIQKSLQKQFQQQQQQQYQQDISYQSSQMTSPLYTQLKEQEMQNQQLSQRTPLDNQMNRQLSLLDSFHNTKSTCSTSSPSPFHTSHYGITPPQNMHSHKIKSYQQIPKLESISLSSASNMPTNSSAGLLHHHQHPHNYSNNNIINKNDSTNNNTQLFMACSSHSLQQSPPYMCSPQLIQEVSLDLMSNGSSNIQPQPNSIQNGINNSQINYSHNSLSKQESPEIGPLQSIQQVQQQSSQQQSHEESPVIYIKNVNLNEISPENVYNIFRNFGIVQSVLFLRENKTILVEYEDSNQAKMAINQLNNVQFLGEDQLRITFGKRKNITLPTQQNLKNHQSQSFQKNTSYPSNNNNNNNININNSNNNQISSSIKQQDYYINKNNDPKSRVGGNQNNNKKNTFYNPASKTVYVTNIPLQLVQNTQNLINLFKPYGTITKHNIEIKDKKVTAFLEFDSLSTTLQSISFLHNTYHYGKQIQIFFTRTILK